MRYDYQSIKAVHLELTSKCNAGCPQCLRYKEGSVKESIMPLHSMSFGEFRTLFSDDFLRQLTTVTLCGNYGDSLVSPSLLDIVAYMRAINPDLYIEMHTNGGFRTSQEDWATLAKLLNLVIFAIDGLSDTNHIYRRNVHWPTLISNVETFITVGGIAEWHYLVFKHNEHQVAQAEALAAYIGFKAFRPKFTDRFLNMRTGTVSDKFVILTNIKGMKEAVGVLEPPTNPNYRNRVTDKMHHVDDYTAYLADTTVVCQAAKLHSIYISSTGNVVPCCWIGYHNAYQKGTDLAYDQLKNLMDSYGGPERFNALNTSIKEVLSSKFFADVSQDGKEVQGEKMLTVCAAACNTDNVLDAMTNWTPAWKRE